MHNTGKHLLMDVRSDSDSDYVSASASVPASASVSAVYDHPQDAESSSLNMLSDVQEALDALDTLTKALRATGLWNDDASKLPAPEAFNSTVPFCLDTMPFEHWLQYVLIPKLSEMISSVRDGSLMPEALLSLKINVHPAAEEYWRGQWQEHRQVLLALRRLDAIFERHH